MKTGIPIIQINSMEKGKKIIKSKKNSELIQSKREEIYPELVELRLGNLRRSEIGLEEWCCSQRGLPPRVLLLSHGLLRSKSLGEEKYKAALIPVANFPDKNLEDLGPMGFRMPTWTEILVQVSRPGRNIK